MTHHGQNLRVANATGFPQGGVASAKFWLFAFDRAVHIINTRFVEGNAYADDCSVLFGGTNLPLMTRRVQAVLDNLVAWGKTCGLHFNPSKTVAMLFTRSTKQYHSTLTLDGTPVPFSDTVRYLGLYLDRVYTGIFICRNESLWQRNFSWLWQQLLEQSGDLIPT